MYSSVMYRGQVPRTAPESVRLALIETAAQMLAARDPVTLRGLAGRVGTTTMAVYTHFGGMPGLWRAVRQEGFGRLGDRLAAVEPSSDAVRDLAALGSAYQAHALTFPDLYRVMFDAASDLEDLDAANRSFTILVVAVDRARQAGRFAADCDPQAVATQYWAAGHGLAMLVISGVLPTEVLPRHGRDLAFAICSAAGDEPGRCRTSITAGWDTQPDAPN